MRFEIGKYILEVDIDKTRDFYLCADSVVDGCDCQGCRNYEKWAVSLSAEPKYIFERMGIRLEKVPEVYVNCSNKDGSLFYGGFYHLCGKVIQGQEPWKEAGEELRTLDEDAFVALTENFRVAFTEDVCLVKKDFPTPVIQMEILANIPFLLPEECCYEG